ncbi:hypothetical protein AAFF_G00127000 [Aldrovandia affinis]|uniref:PiggyBac transposable element-derived protein domain-containing protein n=1 Tax=Aldrovandia affinis TaxID=143900 RepID=A0AAD7WY02_9TELE|nr:hypothetical protein AAFF_G00127000 [Aldrovandia affinis]
MQAVYQWKANTLWLQDMEPCIIIWLCLSDKDRVLFLAWLRANVPPGCTFYHDNLFTSLSLIDEMCKRGYGNCGTLRENRLFGVPLTPALRFKRRERGESEFLVEKGTFLVRWNDNSVVTVTTNMETVSNSTVNVQRWNKKKHAMAILPQPTCISQYNMHMGGVDLHDQCVARYRISIRFKKWWWLIYSWALNSAMVNSWYYYWSVLKGEKDLLCFQRRVAQSLLQRHGEKPGGHGRRSSFALQIIDAGRFDNIKHWPTKTGRKYQWCRKCGGRTSIACEQCDVPLHVECFKNFHTPI